MVVVLPASAQKLYRGIVVDSATMTNLPGVHVSIKHEKKITSTDINGVFLIYAKPTDTLMVSYVGYVTMDVPLLFQEETLFILLRENKTVLNEIIIKSTRLYPNKIDDRTKVKPKTMDPLQAMVSPFDYFWKLEREKRKLSRVVEENNRTQVYRQVITDPDVRAIFMKQYQLTEQSYYGVIEKFNQQQVSVHYYTDPDAIMEALHDFFEKLNN